MTSLPKSKNPPACLPSLFQKVVFTMSTQTLLDSFPFPKTTPTSLPWSSEQPVGLKQLLFPPFSLPLVQRHSFPPGFSVSVFHTPSPLTEAPYSPLSFGIPCPPSCKFPASTPQLFIPISRNDQTSPPPHQILPHSPLCFPWLGFPSYMVPPFRQNHSPWSVKHPSSRSCFWFPFDDLILFGADPDRLGLLGKPPAE